ncbi:melatonin receptor type 1B-like [Exaiptasia diaphana]|uniref:G-protein coupled receptors family 1 profile domain-containing protein n=1 Tax=Exaiptasia diaphana TaxID=2652724 RepID=A0A913YCU7_EXADI|nr:melatonin receptor type 1B-like [Exaiptasia diaphana]
MNHTAVLARLAVELRSRSTARVVFESGVFLGIGLLILVGNAMTLFIVYKNFHLRTVTNFFIVSLAFSDIGMAVLAMPMCFTVLVGGHWPFGDAACQYNGFVAVSMAVASVQFLACTSVNRYFRVVKPNKYRKYFTMKSTALYIALVWVCAAVSTIPYLLSGNRMVFHPGKLVCCLKIEVTWYTALISSLCIGIPTSVTLYCYLRVFQAVHKHNKQFAQSRGSNNNLSVEEIKITRTLFVVMLVYMTCWTPILIIDLIDTGRGYWSMKREVYTFYSYLAVVSSATNPIIYGLMNPQFKKEYLKIMQWELCRRNPSSVTAISTVYASHSRSRQENVNLGIQSVDTAKL